jgi:hypothetical protein
MSLPGRRGLGALSGWVLTGTIALVLYVLKHGLDSELVSNEQGHVELYRRAVEYANSINLDGIEFAQRYGWSGEDQSPLLLEIVGCLLDEIRRRRSLPPWSAVGRRLNRNTVNYAVALLLYLLEHGLDRSLGRNRLARRVIEYAQDIDLDGVEALDGEGRVMRAIATRLLDTCPQAVARKSERSVLAA